MNTPQYISNCPNCNGDLTFNPGEQILDCTFCKSSFTLKGEAIKTDTKINESPQLIIPFAFGNDVFYKAALEWVSQGDYTPANILDSFNTHAAKGIYIPLYIWQVSYVITSPAGSKNDGLVCVSISDGQKPWPADLIEFAKNTVSAKGHLKPFDQVYTLGFEVQPEEIADVDEFYKKAKEFALNEIINRNKLADGKSMVINEMGLTKVYAPFWINKYSYGGQNYEVIMSGSDVAKMGGTRPVDVKAQKNIKPGFKYPFLVLFFSFALVLTDVFIYMYNPKNESELLKAASFVSVLGLLLVFPVTLAITFFRRIGWTDPVTKLKKEREQKLALRLAQKG
jgi:hypothetical protein